MPSIPKKKGRQPSPKTENYIYPPPLFTTMQVKGVEPPGMGVGVGVCDLSEKERAYYVSAVRTASKIVNEAMTNIEMADVDRKYWDTFAFSMSKAVFEKIASPLFYLQSEKREEARTVRKKEASKGLAVEFTGDIGDGVSEWHVASETEKGKVYRVRGDPSKDDYECECPDFIYRGGRCKHIEAVSSLVRRKVSPNDAVRGKVSPPSSPSSRDKDLEQQEKEVNEFMEY